MTDRPTFLREELEALISASAAKGDGMAQLADILENVSADQWTEFNRLGENLLGTLYHSANFLDLPSRAFKNVPERAWTDFRKPAQKAPAMLLLDKVKQRHWEFHKLDLRHVPQSAWLYRHGKMKQTVFFHMVDNFSRFSSWYDHHKMPIAHPDTLAKIPPEYWLDKKGQMGLGSTLYVWLKGKGWAEKLPQAVWDAVTGEMLCERESEYASPNLRVIVTQDNLEFLPLRLLREIPAEIWMRGDMHEGMGYIMQKPEMWFGRVDELMKIGRYLKKTHERSYHGNSNLNPTWYREKVEMYERTLKRVLVQTRSRNRKTLSLG